MSDDGLVRRGGVPLPRAADSLVPRPAFVAPVTLGRPAWQQRQRSLALVLDALAVACLPLFDLLWRTVAGLTPVPALASAVTLSAVGRGLLRVRRRRLRRRGSAMSSVLAVGTHDDITALVDATRRTPALGWRVRGACTSTGAGPDGATAVAGVPVLGDLDGVSTLSLLGRFDAVAVCPTAGWTPARLQQLAWDLDCSRTALLVDPRLVGGDRHDTHATAVLGLPLVQLTHPAHSGPRRVLKSVADRVAAVLLLAVLAPLLVGCALVVRRDGGPALVRRTRGGRYGQAFSMLSFRTTTVDGLAMTPVGRFLRARHLDELPELFNVVGGSMALVGPRPAQAGSPAGRPGGVRHLLVKPGITIPWPTGDVSDVAAHDERCAQK